MERRSLCCASTRRLTDPSTTSHQRRHCRSGSAPLPELSPQPPILLLLLLLLFLTGNGTSSSPHLSLIGTVSAASAPSSDHTNSAQTPTPCPGQSCTPKIVARKEDADLKVLVPNITSFRQFVNCSDPARVRGFCIDVFEAALCNLSTPPSISPNMSIHYSCFTFSSSPGAKGPTYDDMVNGVADGFFDVVVGDVTMGAHRSSLVDFTPKYMESKVVVVRKVAAEDVSPWTLFASPFSGRLWGTIVGAFVFTGLLMCYLEKDNLPELSRGPAHQRIGNVLWFMAKALVLFEKDYVRSNTARGLMLAWLFFAILVSASYTAGLSSFLTVNNLSPSTKEFFPLKNSSDKIGYRRGSMVKDIIMKRFEIHEEQLVPMRMDEDFVNNLTKGPKHGGVVAIVDETPYLSILSSSSCEFANFGPPLTQQGFGFGFNKKKRDLQAAFAIALMNLIEKGGLQQLQNKYQMTGNSECSTDIDTIGSNKVGWKSSISLFIPLVASLLLCIILHVKSQRHMQHLVNRPTVEDYSSVHIGGRSMIRRRHHEVDPIIL